MPLPNAGAFMAAAATSALYLFKPETHREPVDFDNHPWSAVGGSTLSDTAQAW